MAKKKPVAVEAPPQVAAVLEPVESAVEAPPIELDAAEKETDEAALHAQEPVDPEPNPAVYTLADARALPEFPSDSCHAVGAVSYTPPNERAITAFKDADDRTMVVGFTYGNLFKTPKK